MKFKHFTVEELDKMTQDQQRGYVLAELIYGLGDALVNWVKETEVSETTTEQLELIAYMKTSFRRAIDLLDNVMTEDTEKFEEIVQRAVGAPKALNYE